MGLERDVKLVPLWAATCRFDGAKKNDERNGIALFQPLLGVFCFPCTMGPSPRHIGALCLLCIALVPILFDVNSLFNEVNAATAKLVCWVAGWISIALLVQDFVPNDRPSSTKGSSKQKSDSPILVVGGGVAGATTALAMANKGHKIVLFERDMSLQDRIVGELLQPGGIRALERLGLSECAKNDIDSVMVHGYVLIEPTLNSEKVLPYPKSDPSTATEYFGILNPDMKADNAPLGRSFHNGRFVQQLRNAACKHPNITVLEATVTGLLQEDKVVSGVKYKLKSDPEVELTMNSRLTIIADGIWSGMRKYLSDATVKTVSTFVGVILDHPPHATPLPHPYHGHVILADPSPCLLYQISSTETRILVDVIGKLPSASTGALQTYLCEKVMPQLPESLRSYFYTAVTEKPIKSMPSKYFPAKPPVMRGALLIGDALNMRNPLTGGGMTVAIRDAETFAQCFADFDVVSDSHAYMEQQYNLFLQLRKGYSSTINVLANALHAVFSTPKGDITRQDIRTACYDYLSLGGMYAAGPIGLLAGLTPKPDVLTTHFFMVAVYAVKRKCIDEPSWDSLLQVHRIMRVACSMIMPLLRGEQSTILSTGFMQSMCYLLFPPVDVEMKEE